MIIKLKPIRWDAELTVTKLGDVLTINGSDFDFSQLQDGHKLPNGSVSSEFIIGDVVRAGGQLTIPLLLPYPANASEAARFPEDIVDPPDGQVELPQ